MSIVRLRIKGRLYGGFAALVLLGLALAAFAVWDLSAVGDQVGKMTALSDNTSRVLELSAHLQALRRSNLRYQFERLGYFALDKESSPEHLIFNRTIPLRDSWAKVAPQKRVER